MFIRVERFYIDAANSVKLEESMKSFYKCASYYLTWMLQMVICYHFSHVEKSQKIVISCVQTVHLSLIISII